jgi:hypothetical protein
MIYGRMGQTVSIVRRGVLADVEKLDGRKPDKQDRDAIRNGSYVVVVADDKQRLYHQAFMRADGGSREITDALERAEASGIPDAGVTCTTCGNTGGHTTAQHESTRQEGSQP